MEVYFNSNKNKSARHTLSLYVSTTKRQQLSADDLSESILLYLARDGHGKSLHEEHMFGYLEVGNLALTVGAQLVRAHACPSLG